jgi:hypothetical protein
MQNVSNCAERLASAWLVAGISESNPEQHDAVLLLPEDNKHSAAL